DTPTWFRETIASLAQREDLAPERMQVIIADLIEGRCGAAEMAALLIALRMKGETAVEIAAAAKILRSKMIRLDGGGLLALDTCGTGGDGSRTFNISTAAALIVAGTGVPVVKHGNRAVSSQSGSADVLLRLGVRVDGSPSQAKACLDKAGLAFCLAP